MLLPCPALPTRLAQVSKPVQDEHMEAPKDRIRFAIDKLQAAGVDCSLDSSVEGEYEYATLTYQFPRRNAETLTTGWRIGEQDSAANAMGLLMVDVLTLVGEAQLGKLRKLKKLKQQQGLQRMIDASERMGWYDEELADLAHLGSRNQVPAAVAMTTTMRVMLQLAADCELPEYVVKPAFYRFEYCTADVPIDRIEELRKHQGVLGLSFPKERRMVKPARKPQ